MYNKLDYIWQGVIDVKGTFYRTDAAVLTLTAIAAVLCLVWYFFPRSSGAVGVVTSPAGEARYSLSQPAQFTVAGANGLTLTVQIEAGRVRTLHSDCPDQVCVRSGWLSQNGQASVCVPAAVSVRVVGGNTIVDGVTA